MFTGRPRGKLILGGVAAALGDIGQLFPIRTSGTPEQKSEAFLSAVHTSALHGWEIVNRCVTSLHSGPSFAAVHSGDSSGGGGNGVFRKAV